MAMTGPNINTIAHHKDRLDSILVSLCNKLGIFRDISRFHTQVNYNSDCISLVAVMQNGRHYMHPRFLTRQEIENGSGYDNLVEKLQSTIDGTPWEPVNPRMMEKANSFSLSEIEQAQELIDQCKS